MRAETVTYTLLQASTALAALVGGRIYPGKLPQNTSMPAISYELISSNEILPITANAGGVLLRSRVSVTVLGKLYSDVKAVHEQVRKTVNFQSGLIAGVRVVGITRELIGPDTRDDDLSLYMQAVDYLLVHDES
jgi:hypothetical protein